MFIILFGKPLAFWVGVLVFFAVFLQIYLGIRMVKGHFELLKYHKINAAFLATLAIIHATLALLLYL